MQCQQLALGALITTTQGTRGWPPKVVPTLWKRTECCRRGKRSERAGLPSSETKHCAKNSRVSRPTSSALLSGSAARRGPRGRCRLPSVLHPRRLVHSSLPEAAAGRPRLLYSNPTAFDHVRSAPQHVRSSECPLFVRLTVFYCCLLTSSVDGNALLLCCCNVLQHTRRTPGGVSAVCSGCPARTDPNSLRRGSVT